MALSSEKNWVEVLQNLPSYKEYEKLDKVDIKNENSSHCNDLGSTDEGDKTLCKKIVQNLNQLSALKDDENLDNSCYYFQHWFFDNIAKKYYDGDERGNNYPVAEKLYNIVSEITPVSSKMEPCKCYESGYPDVWKEEKHLHDYFENHKDIKCNDSDKSKCEKYIQYVTYINTLFQEKVDKCCDGEDLDEYGFCEPYFKCENKYSPQDLLAQLKKELQELGKKAEAPRDGGTGAVEAGKAPGSGAEEREKKTKEEVTAEATGKESKEKLVAGEVPKEKAADSLAQSALEKTIPTQPAVQGSVGLKPGESESREEPASAKLVGKKPPEENPIAPESGGAKPAPSEGAPAKPVATKPPAAGPVAVESETVTPAMAESGKAKLRETKPAPAKPVAAKPVASKPETEKAKEIVAEKEATKEIVAEEEATKETLVEEEAPEEVVDETTNTLQPEEPLGPPPIESAEQDVHVISSHNTEPASNALPLTITDTPNTLGTAHEGLDSNFFRNIIMAVAVLGKIFFLFYYNRSSRLESSLRKKKRKKGKIFEHNYYEEYEKELEMYGSEETFLDSETDRLYLNYHPDQDSYY
ncbi:variable surface protein Vir12-related [Plasmodium vivax]|uniref:Variable surface protein Vir12-related n=1 Tax=Plasmodium vivax (strain Salvador I) TaxID=126793 RepID=A5KCZ1_PLAVS|nr:variable surface protein Vir12-related [Plasmodium vivax]EDL42779.1 variable surface protein Vir12-related [Plasmodium vivax]|eukprot:XP_001612572.1 variable surface protein Vir12-related [Plasmodium vivax Sal-1]